MPDRLLKRVLFSLFFSVVFLFFFNQNLSAKEKKWVAGDFEMSGYLDTAVGFQHFSNDPITEVAIDGSFGGPIGSWIPNAMNGTVPSPGEDFYQAFVPMLELDIKKSMGKRARLRADIQFGRVPSGSWINGVNLSHAYAVVNLWEKYDVELTVGRFGMPTGFEPVQPYFNDTISFSILWRATLPPAYATGIQLTANLTDYLKFYLIAARGFLVDSIFKGNNLPCFATVFEFDWGEEAYPSSLLFTSFFGPESGDNRPLTFGGDVTLTWWINKKWQLGLEGLVQRDNAKEGTAGTNSTYAGGLLNLHYEPRPDWYIVAKYCYSNQMENGNGVINLTGAKQQIHEISLGFGHYIAEGVKLKFEVRGDIIDPAGLDNQWVAGAATGIFWAF